MAYVDGETLSDKVSRRPLPLDEALTIAIQAAEGLQAAHKKGVVHRDIKSANIMIDTEGRVKIMDFGLAHLSDGTKITRIGLSAVPMVGSGAAVVVVSGGAVVVVSGGAVVVVAAVVSVAAASVVSLVSSSPQAAANRAKTASSAIILRIVIANALPLDSPRVCFTRVYGPTLDPRRPPAHIGCLAFRDSPGRFYM